MESDSSCPACGEYLPTPARMAAHVCVPAQPTPEEEGKYSLERMLAHQRRATIAPTAERLSSDARGIGQQLHEVWDGEVEFLVALRRPNTLEVHWTTNVANRENLKQMVEAIKRGSRELVAKPLTPAS